MLRIKKSKKRNNYIGMAASIQEKKKLTGPYSPRILYGPDPRFGVIVRAYKDKVWILGCGLRIEGMKRFSEFFVGVLYKCIYYNYYEIRRATEEEKKFIKRRVNYFFDNQNPKLIDGKIKIGCKRFNKNRFLRFIKALKREGILAKNNTIGGLAQ